VVGFTIDSTGEVPGKENTCDTIRNNNNNSVQFLYYSVCQHQRAYDRQTLIDTGIKKEQIKRKLN
jgi:hypothetical protein